MFEKVALGIIAGSLLVMAATSVYYTNDYVRVKGAIREAGLELEEERQLENSRRRRGAE